MRVEDQAISLAKQYYAQQGHEVEDVSSKRGHNGYDLLISREGQKLMIEVKGCTREWQIPDLFVTEFDEGKGLVADFLCVVYFIENREPWLCVVPRDAIGPSDVTPKKGYRIRSRIKKQSVLGKYRRSLSNTVGPDG